MADCVTTATTAVAHTPVTLHCATTAGVTDWIIAGGTVVAALGTVGAVSFALYQSRRHAKADLRVEAKQIIENGLGSGGRRVGHVLRLVATNFGPAAIRITESSLVFKAASGTIIGNMVAGGDGLPKVLEVGESVTAEWDYNAVELARAESDGDPYTHLSFFDAFGQEHSTPFPGMRRKRRLIWRHPNEYEPIRPPH